MKWFIFSDPHGHLTELKASLQAAGYDDLNSEHMLLGLGDYFDRGNENVDMFYYLLSKMQSGKAVLLRGNHDDFLLDYLTGDDDGIFNMIRNGMLITVNQFADLNVAAENLHYMYDIMPKNIKENHPQLKMFLKMMKDEFVLGDYIFTHAGYRYDPIANKWQPYNFADTPIFIQTFKNINTDKTYVFGHWSGYELKKLFMPDTAIAYGDVFQYSHFIGIDATTVISKKVNILVIDEVLED